MDIFKKVMWIKTISTYDMMYTLKNHCHREAQERQRLEKLGKNSNMNQGTLRFFIVAKRILKSHVKDRIVKK